MQQLSGQLLRAELRPSTRSSVSACRDLVAPQHPEEFLIWPEEVDLVSGLEASVAVQADAQACRGTLLDEGR